MNVILQTPRLIIREFLPEERGIYLNHFIDEQVLLYIPKRSREERINIFNNALANYTYSKELGTWGIFNKADGSLVGSSLLRLFNNEPGNIEIGFSLERKYWNQGIGTEMAAAMVAYALSSANTTAVIGVTSLENIGSQRVLEKAGLVRGNNFVRDGLELTYFSIERSNYKRI